MKGRARSRLTLLFSATWAFPISAQILPVPAQPFAGQVAPTHAESRPAWPKAVRAPTGAPNVLVILTDDVGFAAASTFGGPVPTPNLDRLANAGLKYNRFHTTAICSPTRASLLTGRNHHMVATGNIVDGATGFPGYWSTIPRSAATIARVLTLSGYNTAMFGKHHNAPAWEQSAAGPFDNWPTGLGFEYFYGFIGGDSDQWRPRLYRGITPVEPEPAGAPQLLDKRLADDAIRWIHNQDAADPGKPFFIYYAPGSTHAPHQAPADFIARFKGQFDKGWDAQRAQSFARQKTMGVIPAVTRLSPRPAEIEAWDSLSPQDRRSYAHMMEVYAGMLAYQDAQIGRILDELERMGKSANTLVMFIEGDNGASAEAGNLGMTNEIGRLANGAIDDSAWIAASALEMGGPTVYGNYPAGWAWALNTPFPWTKQIASHLGGTRNGMVVRWPDGIKARGELRSQFSHVIDIMPTVLDAAGIPLPQMVDGTEQQRVDGTSLVPTFAADSPVAPRTQYFEVLGNRAIYSNNWLANTAPRRMPWEDRPTTAAATQPLAWELYDLSKDFGQSHNLAAREPKRLAEMQALFDTEARRNQVYPIDERFAVLRSRDAAAAHPQTRTTFDYWGSDTSVMQGAAPRFAGRSFTIAVDVATVPGANGVLLANGSWFGGWSFYLRDGVPIAHQAVSRRPEDIFRVAASAPIAPGAHKILFSFRSDGGVRAGGSMTISVNGIEVGSGRIGRTIAIPAGLGETLDIGRDTGVPVTSDYGVPNLTDSAIRRVTVTLQ
ncbi:MAG: arylsulfatase [Sphingomonadales bacterium]|nr:MAG: arylsulfatase [Sphingomonadales bacterium]